MSLRLPLAPPRPLSSPSSSLRSLCHRHLRCSLSCPISRRSLKKQQPLRIVRGAEDSEARAGHRGCVEDADCAECIAHVERGGRCCGCRQPRKATAGRRGALKLRRAAEGVGCVESFACGGRRGRQRALAVHTIRIHQMGVHFSTTALATRVIPAHTVCALRVLLENSNPSLDRRRALPVLWVPFKNFQQDGKPA